MSIFCVFEGQVFCAQWKFWQLFESNFTQFSLKGPMMKGPMKIFTYTSEFVCDYELTSKAFTSPQLFPSPFYLINYPAWEKPLEGHVKVIQSLHAVFLQGEPVLWDAASVLVCLDDGVKHSWSSNCGNTIFLVERDDVVNLRKQLLGNSWVGEERGTLS